jgi:protoporphyrinogen/coproporphyrinogen III oxidase
MRVLVIGAGIAGLGAATVFASRGHTVEVIEANERVGGRAVTVASKRNRRIDAGTQYFHTNYRIARGLLRDLGLERHLTRIKGNTQFFDDRVSKGAFEVSHRLPWFPPAGLSNLSSAALVLRLALNPFDTYGLGQASRLDGVAAWDEVRDPAVREFALRPLVLAGALSEPEVAAPSLLHALRLLKIVVLTDYLTLPQGTASFHEALAARLPVRLGTRVKRLVIEKAAVVGVEIDGSSEMVRGDHVVVATTSTEAAKVLPIEWAEERAFLDSVRIPAVVLPTFFLDRPLAAGIWSYMSQAGRGGHVSFVVDAARKNPVLAGTDNSILQAWPCLPSSEALVKRSDSDVAEICRVELETFFPGFSSWIEEVHVMRHPYAVPFHPAGHQARAADFLRRADARMGVSFCGDYLSGGFMEAALWSATRAASRHG